MVVKHRHHLHRYLIYSIMKNLDMKLEVFLEDVLHSVSGYGREAVGKSQRQCYGKGQRIPSSP